MTPIDPNAPAFARAASSSRSSEDGISTRTCLAGLAMQGLCANGWNLDDLIASTAVKRADALIAALNKPVAQS